MKAIDNKGIEHDFVLDIDAVIQMESEDEDFSFIDCLSSFNKKVKLSNLDKICKAIGTDLKSMLAMGFTIDKIMDITKQCIEDAGFFSAQQEAE